MQQSGSFFIIMTFRHRDVDMLCHGLPAGKKHSPPAQTNSKSDKKFPTALNEGLSSFIIYVTG